MKILVTGANGMLGQDLCPILEDNGYEVIETDIHNLDVTNYEKIKIVFNKERPNFVIHCAAYTHVDNAEEDIDSVELINVIGSKNVAKACNEIGATLVYISTDYVFDGTKTEKYLPTDMTNPLNKYGLTKLQGELAIQKYCKNYYIVRTSWLYGHHQNNFVETMLSYANKFEIKVVDDQVGCPTWTVELANGIVKLIENEPCGIYHVCGSGEISWYEFAKEIFTLARLDVNLIPCKTEEYPRPARRPHYSAMENNGICRNWKVALKDYMELRPEVIE